MGIACLGLVTIVLHLSDLLQLVEFQGDLVMHHALHLAGGEQSVNQSINQEAAFESERSSEQSRANAASFFPPLQPLSQDIITTTTTTTTFSLPMHFSRVNKRLQCWHSAVAVAIRFLSHLSRAALSNRQAHPRLAVISPFSTRWRINQAMNSSLALHIKSEQEREKKKNPIELVSSCFWLLDGWMDGRLLISSPLLSSFATDPT